MFILEFLCIRHLNDGNGHMSRLLTLLLLCRAGYPIGKYIIVEMLMNERRISIMKHSKPALMDSPRIKAIISLMLGTH